MGKKLNAKFIMKTPIASLNGKIIENLIKKIKKIRIPVFTPFEHVPINSISARKEFFLGKSVNRINKELKKYGYKFILKKVNSLDQEQLLLKY